MILKRIAVFPAQAKSLQKEDIYFAKAFSLFIHLSLETTIYISSNVVKLIGSDGNVVAENIYAGYSIGELLEIYGDRITDYIIFIDILKKKGKYLITCHVYNGNNKNLINVRNYILSENFFENTYSIIISNILSDIGEGFLTDSEKETDIYKMYVSNYLLFKRIKDIIVYDDNFFYSADLQKYIGELKKIYSDYREISIIRYIIKKLLAVNNIFFVYEIINSLKNDEQNNDYTLLLLTTTLMEFNQYREAINILNELNQKSVFFTLKSGLINALKAEAYLKLNNLRQARKYIMKSIKNDIKFNGSYELFLEIMFKSGFFLAFKSYLEIDSYSHIRKNSYKAGFWIAKYYSEISVDNLKALSVIEDFKFNIDIIFIYLKILYRISVENDNYDKLDNYIYELYKKGIFDYEETSNNNLEFVKMFIRIFFYMKRKSNILSFSVKEKIIPEPYNEVNLNLNDIEKIIFNYIYDNVSLEIREIRKLLFFILKDYSIGVNKLTEKKEIYYYAKALTANNKFKFKFLKKSLKLKMDISVLNKIIIYCGDNKKPRKMNKFLKIRAGYVKDDEFETFYTARLLILRKKFYKALELIENSDKSSENTDMLKFEIYFNIKKYDNMLMLMKKYNNVVLKDSYLSYLSALVLLKIKNDRKGLFYLQNSYNLNPNKTLQKLLIKEYKRYGIDYLKE